MKIRYAIIFMLVELCSAQDLIYIPKNPKETEKQYEARLSDIRRQNQIVYQQKQQREKLLNEINDMNLNIIQKSNNLEKILYGQVIGLGFDSPSTIERTNVELSLKKLSARKRTLPTDPWRIINGEINFVPTAGFVQCGGEILQTTTDGVFIKCYVLNSDRMFIRNFPHIYADGARITVIAKPSDPYPYATVLGSSMVVNSLDYGIPCSPPGNAKEIEEAYYKITPQEEESIKADSKNAMDMINEARSELTIAEDKLRDFYQQFRDSSQAVVNARELADRASQERVFKYNKDLADKGDSYAMFRVGQLYRDGLGVEKDLSKSKTYFQKALEAGSPEASKELKKLALETTK